MRTVVATRYVTPLREGGSLPALMEADDLGMYVVKFTGAGQGPRALVAEVICAGLGRTLGLDIPETVGVLVDPALAPGEPDEEIQALLASSPGLNLGVDFLPGALDLPPGSYVDPVIAGRIVWFDALVANVDRSWRNPNLLRWHRRVHPIDHGAALTFHHSWQAGRPWRPTAGADQAYRVADHALVSCGPDVNSADAELAGRLDRELIAHVVAEVPDDWLADLGGLGTPGQVRAAYVDWLVERLARRSTWLSRLVSDLAGGTDAATDPGGPVAANTGRPGWLGGPPSRGGRR